MTRAILSFVLAGFLVAGLGDLPRAQATEVGASRTIGLGFAIGEPMSLVGKYFLGAPNALDFGFSFYQFGRRCGGPGPCRNSGSVSLFGDYLWFDTLAQGTAKLDWHFGPGGRLWIGDRGDGDTVRLAARMPVGVDLTFERPDFVEVFFEIAPALYIIPTVDLWVEGMIGVRLYF